MQLDQIDFINAFAKPYLSDNQAGLLKDIIHKSGKLEVTNQETEAGVSITFDLKI